MQLNSTSQSSQPGYSVIITTCNRPEYVAQAIASVKAQTHPALEIIVVIDDGSAAMADLLRRNHPDVVIYQQPNRGAAVARNSGAAIAHGNWICFLDDDDLWHRDLLAEFTAYLAQNPACEALRAPVWFFADTPDGPLSAYGFHRDFVAADLDACHAAAAAVDPQVGAGYYLDIAGDSFHRMLERYLGVTSTTCVLKRTFIRAGGFCPMQACGEDWTMHVNVARLAEWHTVGKRLGFVRLHARQNTVNRENGLYTLSGQINAWYSGRPLVGRTRGLEMLAELAKYGRIYRRAVQSYYWGALFAGQFRLARLVRLAGRFLLPRWRDRLYVMFPPQITWRIEHYIWRSHE